MRLNYLLNIGFFATCALSLSVPRWKDTLSGPSFSPPPNVDSNSRVIECKYPSMKGWAADNSSKTGWLKWVGNGPTPSPGAFNTTTDYENIFPEGVTRKYNLVVDEGTVNLDGVTANHAMLFNGQYPGPWIQACWGDIVEITVTNKLKYNGTALHCHGLRMFDNLLMDGVPGVTQCPIAPEDTFTYRFRATQYGSTWYHSHYSLQYSDGLVGPLTIHGPSSAEYDASIDPLLLGDHLHRSAFQDYYKVQTRIPPEMDSQILNGIGNYNNDTSRRPYSTLVKAGKKYLMRLINTSTDTTFVFSIDKHNFTVIGADLVPLEPYDTSHILIGIGQRYHVILNTLPDVKDGDSFWIRMVPAGDGCSRFRKDHVPDERMGALYYEKKTNVLPKSEGGGYDISCRDEPYERLKPIQKWTVPDPLLAPDLMTKTQKIGIDIWNPPGRPADAPKIANWGVGPQPMWLNYSKPIVKNMDIEDWPETWTVYPANDYTHEQWVYLVVTGQEKQAELARTQAPNAHPLHFHGHDFALLQQSYEPFNNKNLNLKLDNPPRRDVVLLPSNGFVVIAFKADNPGSWLMHCHIAWHASAGLALQILEDKNDVVKYLKSHPEDVKEMRRVCDNWDKWYGNAENHYPAEFFQEDSGI
ncbi:multicopper oxidase [Trichophyton tonsurans CBS 112818]|uniref:Multicopper oxidase n=1 Tax=Trichophyton tonsurans (strain CBS 112818) TaxID=647933 RepID=F2RRF9_TRIT1|nr:multicopper oxidase [Trichophyton tonsurans CBS 112818]